MAVPLPPPGFDDLPVEQKIDYLQSLWERITATPATVPVPDWHVDVVRERLEDLAAQPDAHKALGNPMATRKDGQVVWVQPDDIRIDDDPERPADSAE